MNPALQTVKIKILYGTVWIAVMTILKELKKKCEILGVMTWNWWKYTSSCDLFNDILLSIKGGHN